MYSISNGPAFTLSALFTLDELSYLYTLFRCMLALNPLEFVTLFSNRFVRFVIEESDELI